MAKWTDSTVSSSVKVKAVHINELKNAVNSLITNANLTTKIGTIDTSSYILKTNLSNLQKAINSLQSSFSGNCEKECQSNVCSNSCDCDSCWNSCCGGDDDGSNC